MEAADGILLGGLYRAWALGDDLVYSCTVITCNPHKRFSAYHDKSVPLMLPTSFQVTPVRNSQTLELQGPAELLEAD